MQTVTRLYDRLIKALAILACAMLAGVFVLIVTDVSMRTLGWRPPVFSSAVSEYSLLYMTMFAAPWLVRERGHVRIDSFVTFLPEKRRYQVERMLLVVCVSICLLAAYISTRFAIDFWQKNAVDIRAIEIPRALLFIPLAVGFFLCAVEFIRLLVIGEGLAASDSDGTTDHGH